MCLPALLVIVVVVVPHIERIRGSILLGFWVSVGQISVIVLTLVSMVGSRLFKQWIVVGGYG